MTPTNAVCPVVTMLPEWLDEAVLPADVWLDAPHTVVALNKAARLHPISDP